MTAVQFAWPGLAHYGPTTNARRLPRSRASRAKLNYLSIARPRAERFVVREQGLVYRAEASDLTAKLFDLLAQLSGLRALLTQLQLLCVAGAAAIASLFDAYCVRDLRIVIVNQGRGDPGFARYGRDGYVLVPRVRAPTFDAKDRHAQVLLS